MAKQLSKLGAVNLMLGWVGNSPINSLDSAGRLGEQAESLINTKTDFEQQRRWWFNVFSETLTPDLNGEITLPDNALEVDPKNKYDNLFSMLEGKLFNKSTNTFIFENDVEVEILYCFDFEDLPYAFQYYITMSSAKDLYGFRYPSKQIPQQLQANYLHALTEVNKQNLATGQYNMKDSRPVGLGLLYRRRG